MYEGNIDFNRLWFKLARVRVIGSQLHKQWCDWGEVNQSAQMLQRQHLFYVFCVIANLWQSEWTSIFCTNDIMCHALWHHLLYLSYQFSIFEDGGRGGGGGGGGGGVAALLLNLKFRSKIWPKPLPKLRALSISLNWPAWPVILTMNN